MNTLRNAWKRRWVKVLVVLLALLTVLYLFRHPILRGLGHYLVADDPLTHSEAYFVLGGNSYERGLEAVEIWKTYPDAFFVTTGGNFPTQVMALDTLLTEAALTRHFLISRGVPEGQVDSLGGSTSTVEEASAILAYCQQHALRDITLVSSNFHLRRMRMVFEEDFTRHGITTHFHGAPDLEFEPDNWWQDERGLITTNNEYIKLLYYWLKY